jgi:hypothetical protein
MSTLEDRVSRHPWPIAYDGFQLRRWRAVAHSFVKTANVDSPLLGSSDKRISILLASATDGYVRYRPDLPEVPNAWLALGQGQNGFVVNRSNVGDIITYSWRFQSQNAGGANLCVIEILEDG